MKSFLGIMIFLTSCTHQSLNKHYNDTTALKAEDKAIVLIGARAISPQGNLPVLESRWINERTKEKFTTNEGYFSGILRNNVEVFEVGPGSYHLDFGRFTSSDGNMQTTYTFDSSKTPLASFNVAAGDVVYVGTIICDLTQGAIIPRTISVKDSFKDAQNFINNKYPHLSGALKKNLIEPSKTVKAFHHLDKTLGLIKVVK